MHIYRPIKSNWKTQGFGDNLACARTNPSGLPLFPYQISSKINGTCPIGSKPFYPLIGLKAHNGEDWATWHGEPLYFPVDCPAAGGWWSREASDYAGGLGVDVVSNKPITLNGRTGHVKFRFWHLKSVAQPFDSDVSFGELLGRCNSTGASGGDHLHWSLKWCDSEGKSTDENNGYHGASDFSQWFENTFVLDEITKRAQLQSIDIQVKVANLTLIEIMKSFTIYLQKYISTIKKGFG